MKFSTFESIFIKQNPGGKTEHKNGKIYIQFGPNQKSYGYTGSVFSVAERLDLIPEVDGEAEARRVETELENNECVLGDFSARNHMRDYDVTPANRNDEFGRPLAIYRKPINRKSDPWL